MISLRNALSFTVVAAAALFAGACSDGPANPLSRDLQAGNASLSSSSGSDSPTFDGRLYVDSKGNGSMEIRTGTYDASSRTHTPYNSYFNSITYQVYNGSGKLIQTKKVNFSKSNSQYWSGNINLCTSKDDDDDDDGSSSGASSCSTKMSSNWRVHITVSGKGWNSDKNRSWSCDHDANNNSGGTGATLPDPTAIEPHVYLNAAGDAVLYVGTGTYNPALNTGTTDGAFTALTYKVYNASNKLVLTKSVSFSKTTASKYSTYVDLCSSTSGDDDDDDDHSSTATHCSSKLGSNWTVTVTGSVKGAGGSSKTVTVTKNAVIGYFPDIDIQNQNIYVVGAGGAQTVAGTVAAAAPVTYTVAIPNNKAINGVANTFNADVGCLVYVDNVLQLAIPNVAIPNPFTHTTYYTNPNLFSYVSGATQTINAGSTGSCTFSLSLPAGPHKIAVSALVTSPCEYDITNNTTQTVTVTASSGPPDVAAIEGLKLVNGTTLTDVTGSLVTQGGAATLTQTFAQKVALNSLTVPASVTCKVFDGATDITPSPAPTVTPLPTTVAASGTCQFTLTLAVGTHAIKVTAVSSPTDGNSANDSQTTTVTVANTAVTANVTNVFTGPATVLSGATNSFTGDVSVASLLGSVTNLPVTCKVFVDNTEMISGSPTSTSVVVGGVAATGKATMTWDASNAGGAITVGNNATQSCKFSLKFAEDGNKDVPHTVKVQATAGTTAPVTVSATGTVTAQVRVDLVAAGIFEVDNTGAIVPLDPSPMGSTVTLAAIFHNPDATKSVDFTCSVLLNGVLPGTDISYTPIAMSGTAAPGGDGKCTWSIAPQLLQSLPWAVTATPSAASPIDPNLVNNVATGTLAVKSNGKFTTFDSRNTYVRQEWFNASQLDDGALPITHMTSQLVQVTQLALLVIPTNTTLGSFSMKAQVVGANATYPVAIIGPGALSASPTSDVTCSVQAALNTPFASPPADLPAQYGFSGSICANATTLNGVGGFQQVTVNFTQSVFTGERSNPVLAPGKWAFPGGGTIDVNIELDFTLPGGTPDFVKGTIRIPVGTPGTAGSTSNLSNLAGLFQWTLGPGGNAQIIP